MDSTDDTGAERAPFAVSLAVVQHAFLHAADAVFADLPGGSRGYLVLGVCSHQAPPTQAACAHQLGIDRTVFTYLVDDLERSGLVERSPDPNDRRARRIGITEKGARTLAEVGERLVRSEQHALRGLSAAEQEVLRDLLWKAAVETTPDARTSAELAKLLDRAPTPGRRTPRGTG